MGAPTRIDAQACTKPFSSAIPAGKLGEGTTVAAKQRSAGLLSEHGVLLLILAGIALLAFLFAKSRTQTEERLEAIEGEVKVQAPRAYEPPDLVAHAAREVSPDSLPVARAEYVPVYSYIYYDGGRPYLLETTLSIRNIDPNEPIYVSVVDYYDTQGELDRSFVDRLLRLKPLQTISFLVERKDVGGGAGANFIVEWHATSKSAAAPLIEAVMVGRSGTNAISFVRRSEPLVNRKPE